MKKYFTTASIQNYFLPIILFCIYFIWHFLHITDRDICLDEPYTIYHAQKSIYDIILLTINGEANPPLFMILVHGWIQLFGISVLSIRLLPLLLSSLTIIFLYKSSFKLAGVYAALFTSFLFLFSSLHFYFALEVRTYSLLSFFTAVIYYLYILLIQNEKKTWVIFCIILTNIGIVLSHHFGWFVIANQGIIFLFYFNKKELRKKIFTILVATIILSIPVIILVVKQFFVSSEVTWVAPPAESIFQNYLFAFFNHRYAFDFVAYTLLASLIFFIIYEIFIKKFAEVRLKETLILLICFAVPFTFMYLVSFKVPMFIDRYILFNSIPLYLFVGVAIGKLLYPFWYLQLIAFLSISIPVCEHLSVSQKNFYYREVKNAVDHTMKFKDEHTLVFIHPAWNNIEFVYYYNADLFKKIVADEFLKLYPENIYPIYSMDRVADILKNKTKDIQTIIFYTNGTDFANPYNKIPLDTFKDYTRVDSVFYPQCINVMVYKKVLNKKGLN